MAGRPQNPRLPRLGAVNWKSCPRAKGSRNVGLSIQGQSVWQMRSRTTDPGRQSAHQECRKNCRGICLWFSKSSQIWDVSDGSSSGSNWNFPVKSVSSQSLQTVLAKTPPNLVSSVNPIKLALYSLFWITTEARPNSKATTCTFSDSTHWHVSLFQLQEFNLPSFPSQTGFTLFPLKHRLPERSRWQTNWKDPTGFLMGWTSGEGGMTNGYQGNGKAAGREDISSLKMDAVRELVCTTCLAVRRTTWHCSFYMPPLDKVHGAYLTLW